MVSGELSATRRFRLFPITPGKRSYGKVSPVFRRPRASFLKRHFSATQPQARSQLSSARSNSVSRLLVVGDWESHLGTRLAWPNPALSFLRARIPVLNQVQGCGRTG